MTSHREIEVFVAVPGHLLEGTLATDNRTLSEMLSSTEDDHLLIRNGRLRGETVGNPVYLPDCLVPKSQVLFAAEMDAAARRSHTDAARIPRSPGEPMILVVPGYTVAGWLPAGAASNTDESAPPAQAILELQAATIRPTYDGATPMEAASVLVRTAVIAARSDVRRGTERRSVAPPTSITDAPSPDCVDRRVCELVNELQNLIRTRVATTAAIPSFAASKA